jgi:hypothetical protein
MTAILYNFAEEMNKQYDKGNVPLEYVIRSEMLELGYDPNSKDDVLQYWADCHGDLEDE